MCVPRLKLHKPRQRKTIREILKAVYSHLVYLTYMQSTSCKKPGWMAHKLESRLSGEISTTSDNADDTTLMPKSEEALQSL